MPVDIFIWKGEMPIKKKILLKNTIWQIIVKKVLQFPIKKIVRSVGDHLIIHLLSTA